MAIYGKATSRFWDWYNLTVRAWVIFRYFVVQGLVTFQSQSASDRTVQTILVIGRLQRPFDLKKVRALRGRRAYSPVRTKNEWCWNVRLFPERPKLMEWVMIQHYLNSNLTHTVRLQFGVLVCYDNDLSAPTLDVLTYSIKFHIW